MPSASGGVSRSGFIPASKAIHNMADENIETGAPEGVAEGTDVSSLQARIDELEAAKTKAERNAQTFQNEAMERKRKLERFKDVDPEQYAAWQADFGSMSGEEVAQFREAMKVAKTEEERKLLTERGLEGYLEHHTQKRLTQTQKSHQEAMEAITADLEAERKARAEIAARHDAMRLETAVLSSLSDKYEDTAKRDILRAARESAKFDEDRIVWLIDGEEIFAEGGKPATPETWLARETERNPHWLRRSNTVRAPGNDGGGTPTDNPYLGGSLGQQMRLERENPQLAARLKAAANTS